MMNLSRHIKAILIGSDISEGDTKIPRSVCLTLQHYSFECERPRNEHGMPYGRTFPSTLSLTVKAINSDDCKSFYSWFRDYQMHSLSIVFNASYDDKHYLKEWDAAVIVSGYMVEIDEQFSSWNGLTPENLQMTVKMKVLLSKIRFLGETSNDAKTIDIIH